MPLRNIAILATLILAAALAVACGGSSGDDQSNAAAPGKAEPTSDIRSEPTLALEDLKLTDDDPVNVEMEMEAPAAQLHSSSEYRRLYGDRQQAIYLQRVTKDDLAGVVIYIRFENPAQAQQVLSAMPEPAEGEAEEKRSIYTRQANFIIAVETSATKLTAEQSEEFAETVNTLIGGKRQGAFLRKQAAM